MCRKLCCCLARPSSAYLVEHAGEALSGVDRADEYSVGLCELADRCDAFGGRDRVVLTDKVAAVVLRSAEWSDYWRTRTAGAGTGC